MNKYTRINWENSPSTATALNANNLNHMDEGIEQATDGVTAVEGNLKTATADLTAVKAQVETAKADLTEVKSEVTTARGDYDKLNARLDGIDTTVGNKADKATTLDGYGITDAYTKEKADRLLKNKLDSMPFDTVPKLNSPCYLTSGTVYNALTDKYDSSNIEYGTATLTPYSTQTDKVKTASCEYKKIGNTVIANVHLVMNECAVGSNAVLHLLNMPFKGARITRCLGVSSANNYVCKGQITTAAWFQLVNTSKTTMSFSADEEVDFTVNYKILGA